MIPAWLRSAPEGEVGVRLYGLFEHHAPQDAAVAAALCYGGPARWQVVRQELWPETLVFSVQLGRLSAPVMRYAALGPLDRVLTDSPQAFQEVCVAEQVAVGSVDAVRTVAGAFLEWVRPADVDVAIAEDTQGVPRLERVVALLGHPAADLALVALRRLARLVDGTEAERHEAVRLTLAQAPPQALPGRALSLDEAIGAAARPSAWPATLAPQGLDGFVLFSRGRLVATGTVDPAPQTGTASLGALAPARLYGAEVAQWDALAGALAEMAASNTTRSATWNGYRGRSVVLLAIDRRPVFMELRVERDARVRARALPVG